MKESLHYLLMANHFMIQKALVTSVKDTGLTSGQPKVLDYLKNHNGAVQKDIAAGCHIEPASLTAILNGMETKGLIERRLCPDNHRFYNVYLTETGRLYVGRLENEFDTIESYALQNFSEADKDQLIEYLSRITKEKRINQMNKDLAKKNNNLKVRIPMYFVGLFLMTIGIAISVKSNLGVSPVSSIPYTMTCVWGIEMGKATILFHTILVLIQIILLRRNFKPINLLQIAVGVVFGYFTTFCNYLVSFLPTPENILIRIIMMLISTVFIAVGIFFYLPPNLMPLAGEGAMQAVSQITGMDFSKVKIRFDCTMVLISIITCLITIHSPGSVGIGTVIAAVLVGTVLGIVTRLFGQQRDRLLYA